ncbi:MAG TPA: hypothetical protein VF457_18915, partial [Burkholderiaceae bacterium]
LAARQPAEGPVWDAQGRLVGVATWETSRDDRYAESRLLPVERVRELLARRAVPPAPGAPLDPVTAMGVALRSTLPLRCADGASPEGQR